MNAEPTGPDPQEPTTEETEQWLRTPEGQAAMRDFKQQIVDGKLGEVPAELRQMSEEGLKRVHSLQVIKEVQQRMNGVQDRLEDALRDGPERSLWALLREINEELKALMDLVLEVHEPMRSQLMLQLMCLQQLVESEMKDQLGSAR